MILRLARLFLALALVAGWQASLLHPLEHRDDEGAFVHAAELAAAHGPEGDAAPGDPGDGLCDVLAALGACVFASASGAVPAAPAATTTPHWASSAPRWQAFHAYRAQAPPTVS